MLRKKYLIIISVLSLSFASAQIKFEKGYFINNIGERTDCLIKNIDWKNSPKNFEYKLSETAESEFGTMGYVQEFGIGETLKFIRRKVRMHRASDNTNTLEADRSISLKEEEIYLRVLIEGSANMYMYEDGSHRSFFYSMGEQEVSQLIYKRFRTKSRDRLTNRATGTNNAVAENTQYKQQVLNNLKCETISRGTIKKLPYRKDPLINLFENYNKCMNPDYVETNKEKKGFIFNLSARPGINFSSLEVISSSIYSGTVFDNKTSFRAGLELELFLPFNKNKWSLVFEPTYRNFQSTGTGSRFFTGSNPSIQADYASIEFAIGARYSMFITDKSKIYISFYLLNDMEMDAKLTIPTEFEINPLSNFALGMGVKVNNRISIEGRYDFPRELLRYSITKSEFKNVSLILGYTFL